MTIFNQSFKALKQNLLRVVTENELIPQEQLGQLEQDLNCIDTSAITTLDALMKAETSLAKKSMLYLGNDSVRLLVELVANHHAVIIRNILETIATNLSTINALHFQKIINYCRNFQPNSIDHLSTANCPILINQLLGEIANQIHQLAPDFNPNNLHDQNQQEAAQNIFNIIKLLTGQDLYHQTHSKKSHSKLEVDDEENNETKEEFNDRFESLIQKLGLTPVADSLKKASDKGKEEEDEAIAEESKTSPDARTFKTKENKVVTFSGNSQHWKAESEDQEVLVEIAKGMTSGSPTATVSLISHGNPQKDLELYKKLCDAGVRVNPPSDAIRDAMTKVDSAAMAACHQKQTALLEAAEESLRTAVTI